MRSFGRWRRQREFSTGIVIVLVVVAAALAVAVLARKSPAVTATPNTANHVSASPSPTAEPSSTPAAPQTSISDAMARLSDTKRPFTIAVIGDSTGAAAKGWVVDLAEWINQTYGRSVTINPWYLASPPGYGTPGVIGGDPDKGAVTIWNGSASGQNIDYSTAHLSKMLPPKVKSIDLLFFNHGHNLTAGQLVDQGGPFVQQLTAQWPSAAVVLMTQNPETVTTGHADVQDENMADWKAWASANGYPLADVHQAFESTPGWQKLVDETGIHPTDDGYALWWQTVRALLST